MAKAATKLNSLINRIPGLVKGTAERSKPKLEVFMKYARVELVPPNPAEIPQFFQGFGRLVRSAKTGAWKNLTVEEAWLNTLIGMEVFFCFFIGECIGKRCLIGYQV